MRANAARRRRKQGSKAQGKIKAVRGRGSAPDMARSVTGPLSDGLGFPEVSIAPPFSTHESLPSSLTFKLDKVSVSTPVITAKTVLCYAPGFVYTNEWLQGVCNLYSRAIKHGFWVIGDSLRLQSKEARRHLQGTPTEYALSQ